MKRIQLFFDLRSLAILGFLLVMVPGTAMADSPEWRPTYDLVMMYVNFLILATVIVKYGRTPIKNFLKQQKEDVASEIEILEAEKERVISEIRSAQTHSAEIRDRLEDMKSRLIAQGESKKEQIIEQAQQQSALMIEETRKKMENRIVQAQSELKMELADLAFEQAVQQLPQIMTDKDNQRLVDVYMQNMQA
jgi:F-type H+-transporting ATPase subunit b